MKRNRRSFLLAAAGSGLGMSMLPGAAPAETHGSHPGVLVIPERKVPVLAEADVLVCGGGTAGIAAACSAARHGASTILVERWPCVGGMATAALVCIWHRSDREKMVIYGLVEEAAERGRKRGWVRQQPRYPLAHETHSFDPEGMKIVFQDMLDRSGVRTFCYLAAGEPVVEAGRIRGVLVDTKQGRRAILARIVIDATGDGDIAAKAGCPFDFGRPGDGGVQGMTMMYRVCNVEDAKLQSSRKQAAAVLKEMKAASDRGELPPFNRSFYLPDVHNRSIPNMCPVGGNPLVEEELTKLTAKGRSYVTASTCATCRNRNSAGYAFRITDFRADTSVMLAHNLLVKHLAIDGASRSRTRAGSVPRPARCPIDR